MQRLFLLLALCAATSAFALQPELTQAHIYGATIAIPSPAGLVPLINKDSHYYRFGASLQAAGKNQLLAYFLPAADAAIADIDQLPSPAQWGIAYGLGPTMNRAVTVQQLQAEVIPEVERDLSKAANDPAMRRKLGEGTDAGLAQLGKDLKLDPGHLRMGEITSLGTFTRGDNFATFGAATRIRVEHGVDVSEAPVVTVIGFIVVKDRMFCIAVYRLYRDEKDVELAKRDAAAWSEAITKANAAKP
ncbi:MAG TPA: hypothetical protein VGI57_03530 [Usitatibacter sp.]